MASTDHPTRRLAEPRADSACPAHRYSHGSEVTAPNGTEIASKNSPYADLRPTIAKDPAIAAANRHSTNSQDAARKVPTATKASANTAHQCRENRATNDEKRSSTV